MKNPLLAKLIGNTFWMAPLLMLVADLIQWLGSSDGFYWSFSILFWLSFYVFIGLIIGLVQLAGYSTFSVVSALVAVFGALIGITIVGMSRYAWGVEMEGVSQEILQSAHMNPLVFFTSRAAGITFPIGLILLSIALKLKGRINGLLLAGLIIAVLLFPMGRIPGILTFNIVGDALMLVFFCMVGGVYQREMPEED